MVSRGMAQDAQRRAAVVGGLWLGAMLGQRLSLLLDLVADQPSIGMRWDPRASSIVRTGSPQEAAECRVERVDVGRLQAVLTRPGLSGAIPIVRTFVRGFDCDRLWRELCEGTPMRRFSDRALAGELALWVLRAARSARG